MPGPEPEYRIRLTGSQRRQLVRECRLRKAEYRFVQRRRILLLAAAGTPNAEIERQVGCCRDTVLLWRRRFVEGGLKALVERPRPGRPPRITPQERHAVVALACHLPTDYGIERSQWSLSSLQQALLDSKKVSAIGTTSIWSILNDADLKPHRFQMWLDSKDEGFFERMRDIVEVYTVLVPRGELVLSIDEKTSIQALERKSPIVAPSPGKRGRFESEYIRHGTTCLMACFNVGTGKVLGWCNQTRKQPDFLTFLDRVADAYPSGRVHLVMDNLNTHVSQETLDWNTRHGDRFQFHFTPKHASWLNQVEIWFSILQRDRLKTASFTSIERLESALYRYIEQWNQYRAHPFKWTWKGYPLQRGARFVEASLRPRHTHLHEAEHRTLGRSPANLDQQADLDARSHRTHPGYPLDPGAGRAEPTRPAAYC